MRRLHEYDWGGEAAAFVMAAAALLIAALMSGALAIGHMAQIGAICGRTQPHCMWCPIGAGLGIAGLVVLAVAVSMASVDPAAPRRARPF